MTRRRPAWWSKRSRFGRGPENGTGHGLASVLALARRQISDELYQQGFNPHNPSGRDACALQLCARVRQAEAHHQADGSAFGGRAAPDCDAVETGARETAVGAVAPPAPGESAGVEEERYNKYS